MSSEQHSVNPVSVGPGRITGMLIVDLHWPRVKPQYPAAYVRIKFPYVKSPCLTGSILSHVIFLKIYGLQLPREPHRSTRLLQLTGR